jgi:hypothetical protein
MQHLLTDHCGGTKKVPRAILDEVLACVDSIQVKLAKGAVIKIRNQLSSSLLLKGWPAEIMVSKESKISITSAKKDVGLCVQTGNMARIYADMLKLQTLYLDGHIKSAIVIVPSAIVAKKVGSNVVNSTRLTRELEIFQRVIHLPIALISLE